MQNLILPTSRLHLTNNLHQATSPPPHRRGIRMGTVLWIWAWLGSILVPAPHLNRDAPPSFQGSTISALGIDPMQGRLAAGDLLGRIQISRPGSWRPSAFLPVKHPAAISALAFSPEGQSLVSADASGGLWLWSSPLSRDPRRLQGHPSCIHGIAFHPSCQMFLTCGQDHRVRLWRVSDGSLLTTWGPFPSPIYALAVAPDGESFAVGMKGGRLLVCRSTDGEAIQDWHHDGGSILSLAFSIDGKYLLSAGEDRYIRMWDNSTGQRRRLLVGHGQTITHVEFLHSSRYAVSLDERGLCVLWDLASGEACYAARLPGGTHCGAVWGISGMIAGTAEGRLVKCEFPPSSR